MHRLVRLWQTLRPEPNPEKRFIKTWQNYPKPLLDMTLLQTQYFDRFHIRWIRNICINFLLKVYTRCAWQNAVRDSMSVRQPKNCMGSKAGRSQKPERLSACFWRLLLQLTCRGLRSRKLKSKVRPDLNALLLQRV